MLAKQRSGSRKNLRPFVTSDLPPGAGDATSAPIKSIWRLHEKDQGYQVTSMPRTRGSRVRIYHAQVNPLHILDGYENRKDAGMWQKSSIPATTYITTRNGCAGICTFSSTTVCYVRYVTVYRLLIRLPAKVSADFAGSLIGSL